MALRIKEEYILFSKLIPPMSMKRWKVVGLILMLVVVSAVGWYVQMTVNDRSYSGNWGSSAGRGFDVYNMPLDPAHGNYVRFEVSSTDGRTMDVYFTDPDGLRAARSGNEFEYRAELSAMNTTHIIKELRISEFSHVVVMSHDPDEVVSVRSSTAQSSYPLNLMPVLQAAGLVCLGGNLFLIWLLVMSWRRSKGERGAGRS